MNHGSLFSGIGGFDLAAEWAGWQNMFHCEISEFPRKILNYYWPKSKSYEDIKKTNFSDWRGRIDVISGGFPCQPYSTAGKRLGKEDDRHLWPEMLRVIREVQPRWVVGENVYGLVNWSGGLVFDEVQSDLEAAGYEVQAYVLPAASVGAPHRRDRVWFVAHANHERRNTGLGEIQKTDGEVSERHNNAKFSNTGDDFIAHSNDFPTQSPICGRDDGLSFGLDNITFSKWRSESLKGYGNAIVPQVAYQIFKTINEYEHRNK